MHNHVHLDSLESLLAGRIRGIYFLYQIRNGIPVVESDLAGCLTMHETSTQTGSIKWKEALTWAQSVATDGIVRMMGSHFKVSFGQLGERWWGSELIRVLPLCDMKEYGIL